MKKVIHVLLALFILYGCKPIKGAFYSYKVNTYIVDTAKHFFYSNDLICYGDYLLEFRKEVNINKVINEGELKSTFTNYDTIGVYLLSEKDKFYYEFDTFALKGSIISLGNLVDKPFGQRMNNTTLPKELGVSYSQPTKVVVNNIECFVSEIVPYKKSDSDTLKQKVLLIKNRNFNSLYKVNGIEFPNADYCIIGFEIADLKNRQGFIQEIMSIRPLTDEEVAICAKMVKSTKALDSSTIRSFSNRTIQLPQE